MVIFEGLFVALLHSGVHSSTLFEDVLEVFFDGSDLIVVRLHHSDGFGERFFTVFDVLFLLGRLAHTDGRNEESYDPNPSGLSQRELRL